MHLQPPRVLTIREGVPRKIMDGGVNPFAAESLACVPVPRHLGRWSKVRNLQAVPEAGSTITMPGTQQTRQPGMNGQAGVPQGGQVSYTYLGNDELHISIHAVGFKPGAHAAHIHQGSCGMQGGVVGMIGDPQAGADGEINVDNARVQLMPVSPQQPLNLSRLYVNIHQGDGNHILDANQVPTLQFRPLACANMNLESGAGMNGSGSQPVMPTQPAPPVIHPPHC